MVDQDARLAALLGDAPRAPDPGFVARIDTLVQLDQAYAARRRRAWRRFAGDLVVAGAIIVPALGLGLGSVFGVMPTDHVALLVSALALVLVGWAGTNRWAGA